MISPDYIKKSHQHLGDKSLKQPNPIRIGIFGRIFGKMFGRTEPKWQPKSDVSSNWSSERGNFSPDDAYVRGKPKKTGKAVTKPLESKLAEEFDKEIAESLKQKFPGIQAIEAKQAASFETSRDNLLDILFFLKNDSEYTWPQHMTAVDLPDEEQLELIYCLRNIKSGKLLTIHTKVPRDEPSVPSSAMIFRSFDWHEREVYELFGVKFIDHPDLRKLLLDTSYKGYPMLKGYTDEEHEFEPRPY